MARAWVAGRLSEFQNDLECRSFETMPETGFDSISAALKLLILVQLATGAAEKMDRSDVLDSMARGTQILIESIAQHCALTPVTQVVQPLPGKPIDRAVNRCVHPPSGLLGVAEAVSMDVALARSNWVCKPGIGCATVFGHTN